MLDGAGAIEERNAEEEDRKVGMGVVHQDTDGQGDSECHT